jgi:hypothetical protein
MRKSLLTAATTLALATSLSAHAGLVEGDHLNNGDNLAAYDTDTGLTWLDTKVTADMSYNDVLNAINDGASALSNYRVPTISEVFTLIGNAFTEFTPGFTTAQAAPGPQLEQVEHVYNVLGGGGTVPTRYGLYADENSVLYFMGTAFFGSQGHAYGENNTNGFTYDDHGGAFGTLLVKKRTPDSDMENEPILFPGNESGGEPDFGDNPQPLVDVSAPLTMGALLGLGLIGLRRRQPTR